METKTIYWASRHELTPGQRKMLEEYFGFNALGDQIFDLNIIHERVTFTDSNGLVDYIKSRQNPVVVVAGAIHYLFALVQECSFYIFERDQNKNFSRLYFVDGRENKVACISAQPGFWVESHSKKTYEQKIEERG